MRRLKRRPRPRCDENGVACNGWIAFGALYREPAEIDHAHAWWVANQLRNEQGYDFTPYSDDFKFQHATWLYYEAGELVAGALVRFWPPSDKHPKQVYELCWAWVLPNRRRKGILSSLWPELRRWFEDFYVQAPLSTAMERFLRRPGYHAKNFGRGA